MSNDDFYEAISKTSKSELITLLQEISSAKLNELDDVIHKIKTIINLLD